MTRATFDYVAPAMEFDRLPVTLTQSTSRASSIIKLVLLTPATVALSVPLTLLAAHAIAQPSSFAMISDHPLAAFQIFLGLLVWTALIAWPLKRLVSRLGAHRTVEITCDVIRVTDTNSFRTRHWAEPLASYRGIVHHVRASLSGLRHELVLVHPDPGKNVLIALADRIPQSTLDRARALLNLPELPASMLYRTSPARAAGTVGPAPVAA